MKKVTDRAASDRFAVRTLLDREDYTGAVDFVLDLDTPEELIAFLRRNLEAASCALQRLNERSPAE